jgi:hypothetical protein
MAQRQKICAFCGRRYELTPQYFHRNRIRKDGYDKQCKVCRKHTLKKWTEAGVYCYDSGKDCENCAIFKFTALGKNCRQWKSVNILLRNIGAPTDEDRKRYGYPTKYRDPDSTDDGEYFGGSC